MKNYFRVKHISLAFIFLALGSCGSKPGAEVKIPANVLSEERFAKVLTDFALAESAANLNIKNVAFQKIDTTYAFDPLKENHVSKALYDSSIAFYSRHIDLYKKVYESVLASLSEMQIRHDSLKKDSVSK